MCDPVDLDQKFEEYFHELEGFSLRSERFYDDVDADWTSEKRREVMTAWLKAAFICGGNALAKDITIESVKDDQESLS